MSSARRRNLGNNATVPYQRQGMDEPGGSWSYQLEGSVLGLMLGGQIIDVVFDGVSTDAYVEHGLGRAPIGAIQLGVASPDDDVNLNVKTPIATFLLPTTTEQRGYDARIVAIFGQHTTAKEMTVRFLLF